MDVQEIIAFVIVGLAVLSLIYPLFKKKDKGCDDKGCDCS